MSKHSGDSTKMRNDMETGFFLQKNLKQKNEMGQGQYGEEKKVRNYADAD